jgi:hypothetical protein
MAVWLRELNVLVKRIRGSSTARRVGARYPTQRLTDLSANVRNAAATEASAASDARVERSAAEKIALSRVPQGVIKEAELEREHGTLSGHSMSRSPGQRISSKCALMRLTALSFS